MRPFDNHLKGWLIHLKNRGVTANGLSVSRLVFTTPLFIGLILMSQQWPDLTLLMVLLPLLCLADGFLDISDGVFARVFSQQSAWGAFLDQAADKGSNQVRAFMLYFWADAQTRDLLAYDEYVFGFSVFWGLMLLALGCDLINLLIRIENPFIGWLTLRRGTAQSKTFASALVGKVKTWCQQLGIGILTISFLAVLGEGSGWVYALYASVALTVIGISVLIPPRSGFRRQWHDAAWWALSGLLCAVGIAACSQSWIGPALGQFALLLGILFAALSTATQVGRLVKAILSPAFS